MSILPRIGEDRYSVPEEADQIEWKDTMYNNCIVCQLSHLDCCVDVGSKVDECSVSSAVA